MAELDTSLLEPLAHAWSAGIAAAEWPNPLSSRDGALLRLIPPSERLAAPALTSSLLAVLQARPHVAREAARLLRMQLVPLRPVQGRGGARGTACEASAPAAAAAPVRLSRQERRAALAWMRSLVYMQAGNARQALKVRNRTSRLMKLALPTWGPQVGSAVRASNLTALCTQLRSQYPPTHA